MDGDMHLHVLRACEGYQATTRRQTTIAFQHCAHVRLAAAWSHRRFRGSRTHLRRSRRYEQALLASRLPLAVDQGPDVHRNLHIAILLGRLAAARLRRCLGKAVLLHVHSFSSLWQACVLAGKPRQRCGPQMGPDIQAGCNSRLAVCPPTGAAPPAIPIAQRFLCLAFCGTAASE